MALNRQLLSASITRRTILCDRPVCAASLLLPPLDDSGSRDSSVITPPANQQGVLR